MALQSLVTFVNDIGSTISNGAITFITLNYYLGKALVSILTTCLTTLQSIIVSLATGLFILLEDLSTFLFETCETVFSGFELASNTIEAVISGVSYSVEAVKSGLVNCWQQLVHVGQATVNGLVSGVVAVQQFFYLIGASLLLLVSLIPTTLYLLYSTVKSAIVSTAEWISTLVSGAASTMAAAPLESFIGLVATAFILVSSYRLGRHVIISRNLTWTMVAQWTLRILCYVYLQMCLLLLAVGAGVARTVEFTFAHLHVPRFHHAGDLSDDEEEDEVDVAGNRANIIGAESDDENEPLSVRRRNYNLLLQKRNERNKKSAPGPSRRNKGSPDMEELLFEQVEREREDKLCVVCQDKEKCIMILPCRHLCLCQDCKAPLLRSRNGIPICPICRKNIRQTIKVYL